MEGKASAPSWMWVELAADQTVDVMVSMVYSPREFYCQVFNEDGKLPLHFFLPMSLSLNLDPRTLSPRKATVASVLPGKIRLHT